MFLKSHGMFNIKESNYGGQLLLEYYLGHPILIVPKVISSSGMTLY
jgi:hypothetical protein